MDGKAKGPRPGEAEGVGGCRVGDVEPTIVSIAPAVQPRPIPPPSLLPTALHDNKQQARVRHYIYKLAETHARRLVYEIAVRRP